MQIFDEIDFGWFKKWWLVLWLHPLFKCPFCDGAGGAMEGYYEPEWSECHCWHSWETLEDRGLKWFTGRLPLIEWCRAKLSFKYQLGGIMPFRLILRCRLGFHSWLDEEIEEGLKICGVCWDTNR